MTKKYLRFFVFLLLGILAGWMAFQTSQRLKANQQALTHRQQLPNFVVYTLDSIQFASTHLRSDRPTVLVYFHSECGHCQYEARELKKHAGAFAQVNLLLISTENLSRLRAFSQAYGLEKLPLSHMSASDVFRTFGSVPVPSLFVYNAQRKLVKHFQGETKMESVLKAMNNAN